MSQFVIFIKDWQELAGAFLGSSLAIVFSALGYLLVRFIETRRERRETMRRIEVSTTYTLNTVHSEQDKLRSFVERARKLIAEIEGITNPKEFAMQTINFPTITGIYLDNEFPNFRINSYYLHNKLLWIHSGVQDTNGTLLALKADYDRVLKLNETMIGLMATTGPNPPAQRRQYVENLKLFTDEVERFSIEELPKGVNTLVQTKVYNEKIRQRYWRGAYALWKFEGVSFKYFRNGEALRKFSRNLDSIDRIDASLEQEVNETLEDMKRRAEKLRHDATQKTQ